MKNYSHSQEEDVIKEFVNFVGITSKKLNISTIDIQNIIQNFLIYINWD